MRVQPILLLFLLMMLTACWMPVAPTALPPPPETPTAASTGLPVAATPTAGMQTFLPLAVDGSQVAPTGVASPIPQPSPTPLFPAYDGPPIPRSDIGVQIHLHREDLEQIINQLQALGVGWVKVQVQWKLFEPEPGRYDDALFRELDQLVSRATSHGIEVLLSVAKAPEWSRPTTEQDGPPADYRHFEAFMSVLAQRYQGNLAAYELWNEPNLQREWNGAALSGADFLDLLRYGAEGVRNADPGAIVISGAPATTGIDDGVIAIDDRRFLQQMLDAGLGDVVDAVGVHPYGWANPPDARAANPDSVAPTHNNHPSFFFADTLADYRALLDAAGLDQTPLWVTEFGWGSFDGFGASPPAGAEFMQYVSAWQQAEYTIRAFELGHARPDVGPLFLWNLNFGPLLGPDFSESGYSLLGLDGAPRPVFLALRALPKG